MDNSNALTQPSQISFGISGSALKIVALVTMIIDHIGLGILSFLPGMADTESFTYNAYAVCRLIGRIAFPIYIFLLVEGVQHTRSMWRYALRMLIFAVISEFPFDLALYGKTFDWEHQNVYLTLFFGVLMLWAFEFIKKSGISKLPDIPFRILGLIVSTAYFTWRLPTIIGKTLKWTIVPKLIYPVCAVISCGLIYGLISSFAKKKGARGALVVSADLIVLAAVAFITDKLKTDYRSSGIIAIALMYMFRRDSYKEMVSGCLALTIFSHPSELFALANVFLTDRYNGTRGRGPKYLFYAFYPGHLIIIYLIAMFLGLRNAVL